MLDRHIITHLLLQFLVHAFFTYHLFEKFPPTSTGFAETHQNDISIEGNADIFESLLEFAYTGQLPITDITAYDIITMSNYMQFLLARDTALKYVRRSMRISPEDAFKITLLDFVDGKLLNRLQFYLVSKMKELETSQLFLQEASFQYVMELVERKDLTEVNETEVCRFMCISSSPYSTPPW